jgi:two-component system, NtrC family, response regulator AtoC
MRILFIDDEEGFRALAVEALSMAGHDVESCATGDEACAKLERETFDLLVTDLRMPGRNGIDVLRTAAARMPDCVLIVLTAYASLETAVEALRIGAHDYLIKPLRLDALVRKIDVFARHRATLAENRFLRGAMEVDAPSTGLAGTSEAMARVHRLIAKVAPEDSTVLITGETGTGKELVAKAVHRASPRSGAPFVAINCGSIPETLLESQLFGHVRGAFTGADRDKQGLMEVAGGGTILLDEIGEMPLSLQPKLLRALETREILRVGSTTPIKLGARIIAATHRDLRRMIEAGQFRSDLYYRLNVFEIHTPPLRERPQDIRETAIHLLQRICRRMNRPVPVLDPEALRILEEYRWPGNVRELSNVLERAAIMSDNSRIGVAEIPGLVDVSNPGIKDDLRIAIQQLEQAHIRRVIQKHAGDKRAAADALGISLSSLYRKLEDSQI